MKAAMFFVYLCLLLFGGNGHAIAGPRHHGLPAKVRHVKFTHPDQRTLLSDADLGTEDEYLAAEDVAEEEESCSIVPEKCRWLAGYCLALSYLFAPDGEPQAFRGIPSFPAPSSPRYITLRVLRI